ncbi:MAG TPA: Maf family protein [Anaerolineaceae bacterium]|nr:Maf family protein [Anaerolineaceae bacterium]
MRLILASNSPRRQQLLALTGWAFAVQPANVDERVQPGEAPAAYVQRVAAEKARAVSGGPLTLGSDTIVVADGKILGKPASPTEAAAMLLSLRGRTHQVLTAIAVHTAEGELLRDLSVDDVPMRAYSNAEMEAYVASGDPLDKAGAYAIQHPGFHPVENFSGCYASVMGLPLCHLVRTLARKGLTPPVDVPAACQADLGYACPVFAAVLTNQRQPCLEA